MVLALLKNLIFPARGDEYQRLLDTERGPRQPSVDSNTTLNGQSDKRDEPEPHSLSRCRINPRIISDATIGLSDGLTVPFALTAGLSALGTTDLVIYAGFAELVAGAISMGLGGYLGAKSEADGYYSALRETQDLVRSDPQKASDMARSTFDNYHFSPVVLDPLIKELTANEESTVDFLLRFHHNLAEADFTPSKAYICGLTIACGYFLGGMVPLLPYLFFERVQEALAWSVFVMAIALFAFGWLKTSVLGECSRWTCFKNALQMLVLGGLAAAAAMGCVKVIGG